MAQTGGFIGFYFKTTGWRKDQQPSFRFADTEWHHLPYPFPHNAAIMQCCHLADLNQFKIANFSSQLSFESFFTTSETPHVDWRSFETDQSFLLFFFSEKSSSRDHRENRLFSSASCLFVQLFTLQLFLPCKISFQSPNMASKALPAHLRAKADSESPGVTKHHGKSQSHMVRGLSLLVFKKIFGFLRLLDVEIGLPGFHSPCPNFYPCLINTIPAVSCFSCTQSVDLHLTANLRMNRPLRMPLPV